MTTNEIGTQLGELYELVAEQQKIAAKQQKIAANLLDQAGAERERCEAMCDKLSEIGQQMIEAARSETGTAVTQALNDSALQLRRFVAAAVRGGVGDAQAEVQATIRKLEQASKTAADTMEADCDKAAAIVGKAGNVLWKALAVPVVVLLVICAAIVAGARGEMQKAEQRNEALASEIEQMQQTKEILEQEPLIRAQFSTCIDNGKTFRCVRTDERIAEGAWGSNGATYRIIHGLPPVK